VEWANGIQQKAIDRIRYWAQVSREFPIYCEDSFSIDRFKGYHTNSTAIDGFLLMMTGKLHI